jgi:MFS family permease
MLKSAPRFSIAPPILIQAIGRGLYQFASAVLLFYMPIVFVNYAHLAATQVGLVIGLGAIAGFFGNFLGGAMTDSPQLGRRGTIMVATVLSIASAAVITIVQTLPALFAANILFGVGTGLYWTAAGSGGDCAGTGVTQHP